MRIVNQTRYGGSSSSCLLDPTQLDEIKNIRVKVQLGIVRRELALTLFSALS